MCVHSVNHLSNDRMPAYSILFDTCFLHFLITKRKELGCVFLHHMQFSLYIHSLELVERDAQAESCFVLHYSNGMKSVQKSENTCRVLHMKQTHTKKAAIQCSIQVVKKKKQKMEWPMWCEREMYPE